MRAVRRDVLPRLDLRTTAWIGVRDGDPGSQGRARHPSVPDRVPPARGRVGALDLGRGSRHLRFLLVGGPPTSSCSRHGDRMLGTLMMLSSSPSSPSSGMIRASTPRSAARCSSSSAFRCSRWGCARARTASISWTSGTPGSAGCGQDSGSSTALAGRGHHRRRPDLGGVMSGSGSIADSAAWPREPRRPRRHAHHGRHRGLLHLVPAQHPGPAPSQVADEGSPGGRGRGIRRDRGRARGLRAEPQPAGRRRHRRRARPAVGIRQRRDSPMPAPLVGSPWRGPA